MRFVSIEHLAEGMILGKPFYGHTGNLLIQSGVALTEAVIHKLRIMGYMGLYIEDAFSEGLEIENVISYETRRKAAKSVRRLMTSAVTEKSSVFQDTMNDILNILNQIIDEIMDSNSSIINIIDMKDFDSYTYQHSINVCVLTCVIGMGYNLPRDQLYKLAASAILHDIGKMFIDRELLKKPGALTPEEYEIMKTHSTVGVQRLKLRDILPSAVISPILQHHEKYNGNGYPFGTEGKSIPLHAQIISIVDVYDAITTRRPYRNPIPASEAYEYILGNSGLAFCPELVEVFAKKIAPFPLGVQVLLSNGQKGIVYKNYEDNLIRPLIKLEPTPEHPGERYIDLKNDTDSYNITVEKVLQ
jgi:HD-GYP domain-containing protein (c-di-GMP phosphodiesterase class II)